MSIVKAGFSPGLHGRRAQASAGRRIEYIARTQDDGERPILYSDAGPLSCEEAVQHIGGRNAEYHGVILHYTHAERAALREKFGSDHAAQEAMGRIVGRHLAGDANYVIAAHGTSFPNPVAPMICMCLRACSS